jgi:hypothetical protein
MRITVFRSWGRRKDLLHAIEPVQLCRVRAVSAGQWARQVQYSGRRVEKYEVGLLLSSASEDLDTGKAFVSDVSRVFQDVLPHEPHEQGPGAQENKAPKSRQGKDGLA